MGPTANPNRLISMLLVHAAARGPDKAGEGPRRSSLRTMRAARCSLQSKACPEQTRAPPLAAHAQAPHSRHGARHVHRVQLDQRARPGHARHGVSACRHAPGGAAVAPRRLRALWPLHARCARAPCGLARCLGRASSAQSARRARGWQGAPRVASVEATALAHAVAWSFWEGVRAAEASTRPRHPHHT